MNQNIFVPLPLIMRKIDVYRQWQNMVAPNGETVLQQAVRLRIAPSNIIDQIAWVNTFEKACEKTRYGARQVAIDCVSRSYGGGQQTMPKSSTELKHTYTPNTNTRACYD